MALTAPILTSNELYRGTGDGSGRGSKEVSEVQLHSFVHVSRLPSAILDQFFLIATLSIAERYKALMKKLSECS
jgi:hypothetical protein